MDEKRLKQYNYPQIPDVIREIMAEFLGNFAQIFMLLTALYLPFIEPNIAKRQYTDPDYCVLLPNNTCDGSADIPLGKKEGQNIYDLHLGAINVIVIAISWSAGLLGSLLMSVPVSGGYLNPAITVTLASMSRLEWKKLLHYIPAQYCGAFFAALCFHVLYSPHITEPLRDKIFTSVVIPTPHKNVNMLTAVINSFMPSAIFSLFVFAVLDTKSNGCPNYVQPVSISLCFLGLTIAFFHDSKFQLSPAHDFGTRLYGSIIIGFEKAFSYCFWWFPQQICLYLGFLSGGWLYKTVFESEPSKNDFSKDSIKDKTKTNSNTKNIKKLDENQTNTRQKTV